MNYEEFLNSVESNDVSIDINPVGDRVPAGLDNEALFQLPLIAMIILLMSKSRRKPVVSEIGQLVGKLLEDTMGGFKGSSQYLGWSANLRMRTVTAVNFLESVELVYVNEKKGKLDITELGKKVINRAIDYEGDLSYNLGQVERAYRNFCVDKKLDGELL
ncbi:MULTISPECIES: hypothetical protein [Yersinia]|uniref:hypothetical protein n=1 Tax=Yersinia TaxID=629 RepID=UPI000BFD014D|nr:MULTISPECIES: hypothetical protein [Yersinia]ATM86030.1 hypothetical protein CRN74_08030 [Yersinia frederiksenii]MCB5316331.1 hypothetical protein [Yersinia massiliensis]